MAPVRLTMTKYLVNCPQIPITMLSKLRKSFRLKKSFRRYHDDDDDDRRSDSSTLRSQSSRRSSLSSVGGASSSGEASKKANGQLGSGGRPGLNGNEDCQWQRATPSVVESNRTMFNRQLQCDVVFVVGEGRALVGAHRFVLVSRSDVFYRMFCGPMAETGPVVVPDVTEDVFREFLE